jgi:hypothetical protein
MFKLYLRMIAHWFSQTRLSSENARTHTHNRVSQRVLHHVRARHRSIAAVRRRARDARPRPANPKQSPRAHPSAARRPRAHRAPAPSRARNARRAYLCLNPRPSRAPSHPASTTRPPNARPAIDRARHATSFHRSIIPSPSSRARTSERACTHHRREPLPYCAGCDAQTSWCPMFT